MTSGNREISELVAYLIAIPTSKTKLFIEYLQQYMLQNIISKQINYREKGFFIGLKDLLRNKLLGQKTQHYVVDLALRTDKNGRDIFENAVKVDGEYGQFILRYTTSTKDRNSLLLIGIEAPAPSSPNYSKQGKYSPYNASPSCK